MTGLHEPGTSHFELMQTLAPAEVLQAAHEHMLARGYLGHEFGDAELLLAA